MAEGSVARNANIVQKLDATTASKVIELYRPGFLNPFDMFPGLKYSGYITSLRATVRINSISELAVASVDNFAPQSDIDAANLDTFKNNQKKCFTLLISNSTTPPIEVADIHFYNQQPYYYVNLLRYLTSDVGFSCASDTVISLVQKNVNYGLLSGSDEIVIIGSVVEEAYQSSNYLALET